MLHVFKYSITGSNLFIPLLLKAASMMIFLSLEQMDQFHVITKHPFSLNRSNPKPNPSVKTPTVNKNTYLLLCRSLVIQAWTLIMIHLSLISLHDVYLCNQPSFFFLSSVPGLWYLCILTFLLTVQHESEKGIGTSTWRERGMVALAHQWWGWSFSRQLV